MKHHIHLSFIILLVALNSCAPKVVEFLNDDMDFGDYETYRLITFKVDDNSLSRDSNRYFDSLEFNIHQQMESKSFVKGGNNAHLVVRYEIVNTLKTTSSSQNTNYYDPYNYYRPVQRIDTSQEGVLLIEFLDSKKRKLVWQASLNIRYPKNKDKIAIMKESIDKIFLTYPYIAGSDKREEKN